MKHVKRSLFFFWLNKIESILLKWPKRGKWQQRENLPINLLTKYLRGNEGDGLGSQSWTKRGPMGKGMSQAIRGPGTKIKNNINKAREKKLNVRNDGS